MERILKKKSGDCLKRKIFYLSRKLTEGDLKQTRSANSLLNILYNDDGGARKKFRANINNINAKSSGRPEIITETAFKSRVKDIILTYDKSGKGFKPLNQIINHAQEIKKP